MSDIDWSKAPEGATHYDSLAGVFCNEGENLRLRYETICSHEGWGTDRYVPLPVVSEYDGTEFPKIGTICEMLDGNGIFVIVEIFAAHEGFHHGWSVERAQCYFSDEVNDFRPIKTDRSRVIEEMLSLDCEPAQGMLSRAEFCGELYDAGYKKVQS